MTPDRSTIVFNQASTVLPNPFSVPVSSPVERQDVVPIEALPASYGAQLSSFIDDDLLIEIELEAEVDGNEVGSNRLVFPLEICEACFTFCASDPAAPTEDCGSVQRQGELCIDDGC
jgi:hypothetical protein